MALVKDMLSIRVPAATLREFRAVAVSRNQSLSGLLQDAATEALTYHAMPGECTVVYPPKYLKVRQGARKAELRRRGR